MNQFVEPDVKQVDGNSEEESSNHVVYQQTSKKAFPDETFNSYHQQLSNVYPSASDFYNRFARVMRKRGNPYWMPRTYEMTDPELAFAPPGPRGFSL